jgi:hypothetical protein
MKFKDLPEGAEFITVSELIGLLATNNESFFLTSNLKDVLLNKIINKCTKIHLGFHDNPEFAPIALTSDYRLTRIQYDEVVVVIV